MWRRFLVALGVMGWMILIGLVLDLNGRASTAYGAITVLAIGGAVMLSDRYAKKE